MSKTHEEIAAALRELADWVEYHPRIPMPQALGGYTFYRGLPDTKEEIQEVLRELVPFTKFYDDYGDFVAEVAVGDFKLRYYTKRENVCKKLVVGHKLVPEQVIKAQAIPEHVEEIVEWDCQSVLAPEFTEVPIE